MRGCERALPILSSITPNVVAEAFVSATLKAASDWRYVGHTLTDNHHGLVVNARVSCAHGHADREAPTS
jgi:hypothetical protein